MGLPRPGKGGTWKQMGPGQRRKGRGSADPPSSPAPCPPPSVPADPGPRLSFPLLPSPHRPPERHPHHGRCSFRPRLPSQTSSPFSFVPFSSRLPPAWAPPTTTHRPHDDAPGPPYCSGRYYCCYTQKKTRSPCWSYQNCCYDFFDLRWV